MIGNRIANRIINDWRSSPQNTSEIITNEHDEEVSKQRYISLEERQKIIDDLRLIW